MLPLEIKNTQKNENRRLGFIKSLEMLKELVFDDLFSLHRAMIEKVKEAIVHEYVTHIMHNITPLRPSQWFRGRGE